MNANNPHAVVLHMEHGQIQSVTSTDPGLQVIVLDASEQQPEGIYLTDYQAQARIYPTTAVDHDLARTITQKLGELGIHA